MYKKTKQPTPKVIDENSNATTAINLVLIRFGNLSKLKFLSNMIWIIMDYSSNVSTDTKWNQIDPQSAEILNVSKANKPMILSMGRRPKTYVQFLWLNNFAWELRR